MRIEGNDGAGLGTGGNDCLLQLTMLQVLQAQIDTERQVSPRARRLQHTNVAHHITVQILDVLLLAGHTLEPVVISQFQPGDALLVHISQTHQLCGNFPCRIKTSVLPLSAHTLNAQRQYLAGIRGHHMAMKVHELLATVAMQALVQCCQLDTQRISQLTQALRTSQNGRVGPDRNNRGAHRQRLTPTIGNNTAVSGNFSCTHGAHGTLVLQEFIAALCIDDLQGQDSPHQQEQQSGKHCYYQVIAGEVCRFSSATLQRGTTFSCARPGACIPKSSRATRSTLWWEAQVLCSSNRRP